MLSIWIVICYYCSLSQGFSRLNLITSTTGYSCSNRKNSILYSGTIELTKDGGVKKEVIIPGQGKVIEPGDIIAVEYSAALKDSGKLFSRGEQEKFVALDGSLIKGLDIAIESMKIGEKAKVLCSSRYGYGDKGVGGVIPPGAELEIEMKVLAWLGNQLRPETLFAKDLDVDPFIASTPESIQAEYEKMQEKKVDKYQGNIIDIYLRRIRNISFGFGGSGFFTSQSGEKAPWYLNPNLTFPAMITFVLAAFITVFSSGAVKEKGIRQNQLEGATSSVRVSTNPNEDTIC